MFWPITNFLMFLPVTLESQIKKANPGMLRERLESLNAKKLTLIKKSVKQYLCIKILT